MFPLTVPLWRTRVCPAYLGRITNTSTQPCLCKQWMKLHSTSESLEILCQKSLREPMHILSGWGPPTSSPATATHLGSVPSMGLTLLGALLPFPSQGDPLHYKARSRWPSHLETPPWSFDVRQRLVPHSSCSPTSASFQALHCTGLPGRCTPASPPPRPE